MRTTNAKLMALAAAVVVLALAGLMLTSEHTAANADPVIGQVFDHEGELFERVSLEICVPDEWPCVASFWITGGELHASTLR